MSTSGMTPANLVGAVIRSVLAEPHASADEPIALSDSAFTQLLGECELNRITPLLVHALSNGVIELRDDQAAQLMEQQFRVMTTSIAIENVALRAIAVLEAGGVDVRVAKGLATAHIDYSNPALRQFGDADLLVPPGQFNDAVALLAADGMKAKYALRGSWQVEHSVPIAVDGLEIDLHHRLLHQAGGHLAARLPLFANPEPFGVGGRVLHALPAPIRLIQAAGQNILSALEDPKHSSDVDVLMLSTATDEAYGVANEVGLGWLLDLGIARAHRTAGLAEPMPRGRSRLVDRYLCRTYEMQQPSAVRLALAEALVAPPRATAANVWSIIAPGEEYLVRRGRSQKDQLRRQLDRTKQLFGGSKD